MFLRFQWLCYPWCSFERSVRDSSGSSVAKIGGSIGALPLFVTISLRCALGSIDIARRPLDASLTASAPATAVVTAAANASALIRIRALRFWLFIITPRKVFKSRLRCDAGGATAWIDNGSSPAERNLSSEALHQRSSLRCVGVG